MGATEEKNRKKVPPCPRAKAYRAKIKRRKARLCWERHAFLGGQRLNGTGGPFRSAKLAAFVCKYCNVHSARAQPWHRSFCSGKLRAGIDVPSKHVVRSALSFCDKYRLYPTTGDAAKGWGPVIYERCMCKNRTPNSGLLSHKGRVRKRDMDFSVSGWHLSRLGKLAYAISLANLRHSPLPLSAGALIVKSGLDR